MTPEQSFSRLLTFLDRFDGLEFLCQASMTYLFAPEGKFHSESDEVQIWGRRLEFASGLYATKPLNRPEPEPVTGDSLEEFKKFIDAYYTALDLERFDRAKGNGKEAFAVESARIYSQHVRGDAYPHQFEVYAREVYGEHDEWFLNNLGFTIADAYSVANAMVASLNERFNRLIRTTAIEAERLVDADTSWMAAGLDRTQAVKSAHCQIFFGRAKEHLRFTTEDVVNCSMLSRERCVAALKRLSQVPPYRNQLFPDTFRSGREAAWDYNTLAERPLISDGIHYWLPVPFLFRRNLYYTFYFDLMGDLSYRPTFERCRGKYLEQKVANCLKRVFPESAVFLNPAYPDGNEFCDVLVLHDGKILIVQCKSKAMTRQAHIGLSASAVRSDLEKAIKGAVEQGVKCRKFLEASDTANLLIDGHTASIKMEYVTGIDIVATTFMPLHTMATRIREVEEDLGMSHSDFPAWAVSLGDLEIVADISHSPARFLQYVRRRLLLEQGQIRVHGDEMDLLAFFLTQGLWMRDERFAGTDILAISGFSGQIDEYVFRVWDCNEDVPKPEVPRPEGFYPLVDAVERLSNLHRTDCAITLLEASGSVGNQMMETIETAKQKTRADGKSHSVSFQGEGDVPGISFQTFPIGTNAQFANERTEGFGFIKKYAEKLPGWAAFGWIDGSRKEVNTSFWLEFPWTYNGTLEPTAIELRSRRTPPPERG
jgi:hypothetical protein